MIVQLVSAVLLNIFNIPSGDARILNVNNKIYTIVCKKKYLKQKYKMLNKKLL